MMLRLLATHHKDAVVGKLVCVSFGTANCTIPPALAIAEISAAIAEANGELLFVCQPSYLAR